MDVFEGSGLSCFLKRAEKKKVPAIQAEQVEDDVAPVTAEYVPAKVSHEE